MVIDSGGADAEDRADCGIAFAQREPAQHFKLPVGDPDADTARKRDDRCFERFEIFGHCSTCCVAVVGCLVMEPCAHADDDLAGPYQVCEFKIFQRDQISDADAFQAGNRPPECFGLAWVWRAQLISVTLNVTDVDERL